jgi:hypothetical protein
VFSTFASLANPLAALRQRDALQFAGHLGGEIIHADPNQAGAFAQRPGVTGVETQVFGHFEAADQRWLQAERCVPRRRGNLQCWLLHDGAASSVMVDQ